MQRKLGISILLVVATSGVAPAQHYRMDPQFSKVPVDLGKERLEWCIPNEHFSSETTCNFVCRLASREVNVCFLTDDQVRRHCKPSFNGTKKARWDLRDCTK